MPRSTQFDSQDYVRGDNNPRQPSADSTPSHGEYTRTLYLLHDGSRVQAISRKKGVKE